MKNLYKTQGLQKTYNYTGIYLIQVGNRMYVGSSLSIGGRLLTHKHRMKNNKHCNPIMINCFNKYGEDHCHFKILEECSENVLAEREKFYIDVLKPELNIELDPVRQDSDYKKKCVYQYDMGGSFIQEHDGTASAERYLNRSSSKISQCAMGKRKSAYGFLWSYTKVDKLVYENNSSKAKAKRINQYDKQDRFINQYDSVAHAVRSLKLNMNFDSCCANVSAAALGKTPYAYGFVWSYE